ncbi:MAG TPA: MFS transporter, partial [Rhizomicrobium sp.]|nr:MFS transporter [Rhizomicrobium sp.]
MTEPPSLSVYRDRDLPVYLSTRFLSTIALMVQSVAVGWQIYDISRDPLSLGLVGLSQFLPMFLLTLPAGEISDRFDQRKILAAALVLEAVSAGLLFLLTFTHPHTTWPFYAVLVLFGAARGFSGPAGQSLLPFLVTRERLPNAIAWGSSVFQVAVIAGPAIGGFVYALGPAVAYALCAMCYLGAGLGTITLGGRRRVEDDTPMAGRMERVKEGVQFVRTRPVVMGAISLDLFAVLLGGATALLPVFARDILHA